jgi:hypothetical protein
MFVNMRYEYSRVSPDAIAPASKTNPTVKVCSSGILPLHFATLLTCGLTFAMHAWAGSAGYFPAELALAIGMMVASPVAIITSVVYTLIRGDLRQWWAYTEV